MQIWLDQVRDEPFNWDETQKVSPEVLDRPELLDLGPVSWRGQVVYADPGYFLRARLSYEQTLSCNRCLKPIVEQAQSDVELMILVEPGPEAAGEHALHEQDLGILYLQDELLETDPILIEQLQLNIPMKPLCREDCQGLCPICGADRNAGACSCEESTTDPRWAALAALRGRLPDAR
ncbi:MAG TPA: DUF177 domain-containing protein [Thermoanaerobaculia bacterium]|jgi:uncharacterized protein|nr:DUF177 domain-containing protein [Thermoanaerobaculia bacterium]